MRKKLKILLAMYIAALAPLGFADEHEYDFDYDSGYLADDDFNGEGEVEWEIHLPETSERCIAPQPIVVENSTAGNIDEEEEEGAAEHLAELKIAQPPAVTGDWGFCDDTPEPNQGPANEGQGGDDEDDGNEEDNFSGSEDSGAESDFDIGDDSDAGDSGLASCLEDNTCPFYSGGQGGEGSSDYEDSGSEM